MLDFNAAVLKGFGLLTHKARKEKAYFVCETPNGTQKIYKTSDTAEKLRFQHEIKEHLFNAGYPWVDRYALGASGQPFVAINDDRYVMTPYIKGREADFESPADITQVLKDTARFHTLARQLDVGQACKVVALPVLFDKQLNELSVIAKRVRKQARRSDFDVLLIKNADYYARQIKNALSIVSQAEYQAKWLDACTHNHICHNALKEESLILAGHQTYITHFSNASVDVQLNDVAALIRRHVQRAGGQAVPARRLLEAYDRVVPLSRFCLAALYALLLFPSNFIKIVHQYYSKKRSWTPNAITNRMLAVIDEKDYYEKYISELAGQM